MRDLEIKEGDGGSGFVLMYGVEMRDDVWETVYIPIEDSGDEHDLFRRLLERVAEHFGYEYNKYGFENLNIKFDKPGHKVG